VQLCQIWRGTALALIVRQPQASTAEAMQGVWERGDQQKLTVSTRVLRRTMRFLTLRSLSSRLIVTYTAVTALKKDSFRSLAVPSATATDVT
jgi:hypothetical protein